DGFEEEEEEEGARIWRAAMRGEPVQPYSALRLSEEERRINTQLAHSDLSTLIRELSYEHATASDTPRRMLQLLHWLRRDFRYTLQPETPEGVHPLQAFLTLTHKGHCEYFASAFVLLLRAQNIPARVV